MPNNFNCKKCQQIDNERMVQCDRCDKWYHFNCVGVNSKVADVSWNCDLCDSVTSPSSAERQANSPPKIAGNETGSKASAAEPQNASSNRGQLHLFELSMQAAQPASASTTPAPPQSQPNAARTTPICSTLPPAVSTYNIYDHRPTATSSPATEAENGNTNRHVQFTSQPTFATAAAAASVPFTSYGINKSFQTGQTNVSLPNGALSSQTFLTSRAVDSVNAASTSAARPLLAFSAATTYPIISSLKTTTTYPPYSEGEIDRAQQHPYLAPTQPNFFAQPNAASRDRSFQHQNLQLERLEEEMKLQQQYLDNKYKILSQSGEFPLSCSQLNATTNTLTTAQLAARQTIPKQLPAFSGDPDEWPLFISSFENSTALAGLTNAENLMRLQSCLKGQAREMVKNKLLVPAMVPEIVQTLRMCFGRPEHILERAMNKARSMPPVKDKLESLIEFALYVRNISATMESCNMEIHLFNPFLVKELVDKLPNSHKLNWAMHPKEERAPIMKLFSDWLYQIAEAASTVVSPVFTKGKAVNTHTIVEDSGYAPAQRAEQNIQQKICSVCEANNHKVPQCDNFKSASLSRKWEYVRQNNLCRQCLGTHRKRCFFKKPCGIDGCTAKHHQLLHEKKPARQVNSETMSANAISSSSKNVQVNTHSSSSGEKQPYFRIVPINIYSRKKNIIKAFAFLDEGSAVTLIDKNIFDELDLEGEHEPLCLRWTANTTRLENGSVKANIQISNITNYHKYELNEVHTVDNLDLPAQSVDAEEMIKKYPYLAGLPIPSYSNIKPTVLIGANNWRLAVPLKVREGNWNQPIATKTRLGWTIQGCSSGFGSEFQLNIHMCDCNKKYAELHEEVKEYFNMEEPKSSQLLSADDSRALKILNETCREINGRYEVGLTWRHSDVVLPESYSNALKRSMCLFRKIEKDPALKTVIQEQINNLVAKGYAEKISVHEKTMPKDKIWYLPIFIITNPNKPGKIRLVWDAAAKSSGSSLNDFLLAGPDFLNPLVEVLLAFRVGRVAICADIAEMFHRINVRESDMHAQRFLWWEADDEPQQPSIYVMRALTFGISCAPFIAHFIRDRNSEQFKAEFPRAVDAIQKYHYVDDLIDSEDDELAAIKLAKRVKEIHAAAGFNIRNWSSNSTELLQELGEDPSAVQNHKEWGSATKVLGMFWDPTNDMFKYICRFAKLRRDIINEPVIPTKRETLQVLMSIFDPLGFVSCYTIGLKILLQNIWRSGIGWDEALTDVLQESWLQWKLNLPLITSVEIPRCYSPMMKRSPNVQLHTFVDAGENAYAAVSYLRIEDADKVSVALLGAKSKVAPLKPQSIPRLELQGAVIGVRLANKILNVNRIRTTSQFWWTDSKTVLKWLQMDPKNFKQYVMHRIGEILESSDVNQWRWVPSKINPADLATKVSTRPNCHAWFSGPEFLLSNANDWPQCKSIEQENSGDSELKRCVMIIEKAATPIKLNIESFSNWRRLYRAVATFILYLTRLQVSSKQEKIVNFDMLRRAQQFLYKYAQREEYDEELNRLKQGKPLDMTSKLKALDVYLDEDGIMRSKGREEYLNNHEDAIILPHSHHVTLLLVRSVHENFHHQMHEAIISKIRSQFFISRLRVLYRKVRSMCQFCKNQNAKPQVPQMAVLPPARLAAFERPFTYVGIDFFGPLFVAVGRRREKRWGVIFTCLTIRAVHIEVAHSLDTSSCIMVIRNFISRRGSPREIYSDNGTNFKAAEKVLCDEIKNLELSLIFSSFESIKWKFNPPGAPHMGGAWERLVRSVKTILYAICPTLKFNDEGLRSALYEVEFILNSRPLTFVSIESTDDEAITPNHLLIGSSDGYKPICSDNADLRQRWYQTQVFADQFWRRWLAEYVPMISRRSKWFAKQPPVKVGDVVVIVDQDLPRNCWPKGIVVETLIAKDGQVRSVTVKTKSSIFRRPVAKVAVLDVGRSDGKLDATSSFTGEGMLPPSQTTAEK